MSPRRSGFLTLWYGVIGAVFFFGPADRAWTGTAGNRKTVAWGESFREPYDTGQSSNSRPARGQLRDSHGNNTALEADIHGNVNSTHVGGTHMMNGMGGARDLARNAYLAVFAIKSRAKGNSISSIVPMVSHVGRSQHDVDIIVTEIVWPTCVAWRRGNGPRSLSSTALPNRIARCCATMWPRRALRRRRYDAARTGGQQGLPVIACSAQPATIRPAS